jgi:hypothetical protein
MRHQPPPERSDLLARRFAPLRLVAEKLRASTVPADAFFDPDDFMLMSWCRSDRPKDVMLFKHIDTRRYLNLDGDGAAYRCVPPATDELGDEGAYVRHATLREAVDAVGLWELPWMRPELAAHRQGRAWEDRWDLYEELNGDGLDRAS